MTVLNEVTKAARMRQVLGKLTGEYIAEGKTKAAGAVAKVAAELNDYPESLVRLFDAITEASK